MLYRKLLLFCACNVFSVYYLYLWYIVLQRKKVSCHALINLIIIFISKCHCLLVQLLYFIWVPFHYFKFTTQMRFPSLIIENVIFALETFSFLFRAPSIYFSSRVEKNAERIEKEHNTRPKHKPTQYNYTDTGSSFGIQKHSRHLDKNDEAPPHTMSCIDFQQDTEAKVCLKRSKARRGALGQAGKCERKTHASAKGKTGKGERAAVRRHLRWAEDMPVRQR